MKHQITDTILMVRPANFGFNPQTADDNAFQVQERKLDSETIKQEAVAQFDAFVAKLRAAGVNIIVIQDTDEPEKPDAVFPNNWMSLHQDGTVITYPMYAFARRFERRTEVFDTLKENFEVTRHVHLEDYELEDLFLESTGSMILDRVHRIAYACRSSRTDELLVRRFCEMMGYEPVVFYAVDPNGMEVYHTNVIMALGETFVIICLETIEDEMQREELRRRLEATEKEVIEISFEQVQRFAGNMLQVRNVQGDPILVMSEQAYRSLTPEQIERIESHCQILYSDLHTIEKCGGGSARCMMAEVFLPKR